MKYLCVKYSASNVGNYFKMLKINRLNELKFEN